MFRYKPGDDVGELEDWPFDNPVSDYKITQGSPSASGRIDLGGPGHPTRFGIWRCTKGTFDCTEQGDELMTILEGRCTLTDHTNGTVNKLETGDTAMMRDGCRVTWDVHEDVTKVFYAFKTGGF